MASPYYMTEVLRSFSVNGTIKNFPFYGGMYIRFIAINGNMVTQSVSDGLFGTLCD